MELNLTPELVASVCAGLLAALAWLDRFIDKRHAQAAAARQANTSERNDEITMLRRELVAQYDRAQADVNSLRERISKLEIRNDMLNDQVIMLERERAWLQAILAQNNIIIPPMPESWAGGRQDTQLAAKAVAAVEVSRLAP